MIPIRDLGDDYYDFDEKNYCLIGRRRHHIYQLGDPIKILVAKANIEKKQLDFTLADSEKKVSNNNNTHKSAYNKNYKKYSKKRRKK